MRFLSEGPSIPDELLVARDEGRVIFFCGAGISRARANLPDFFGLAKTVTEMLGVSPGSPAKRIIEEAREIAIRTGESGLISADRVFGLLEREFLPRDIHAAVAKALTPAPNVDLAAHRVMLDLARGPDGRVRLVTTNFDRLFEQCDDTIAYWQRPRLPDPIDDRDWDGIVHLHGRVNATYTGVDGDGLVLSSSEFGRAYLSDAWATEFIRSILGRYLVVFVGYAADDPPVQYLLEALSRSSLSRSAVFAFQSGDHSEAQAKWVPKGVAALAYEETTGHTALWDTLAAWSNRARHVDAWYEKTISMARSEPEALLPHERGQVAHVVSTLTGARRFASSGEPPPAQWLCVFDPLIRYAKPGHEYDYPDISSFVDPFLLYSLDSDPVPQEISPEDHDRSREVPRDAWNCFGRSQFDREELSEQNLPAVRGYLSIHVPKLTPRLWQIGIWLRRVCGQPAAVWWASGQDGVHPDIQDAIRFELEHGEPRASAEIRKAWHYILETWSAHRSDTHRDLFQLKATVAVDGWGSSAIRSLVSIHKPHVVAQRPWHSRRPPRSDKSPEWRDIVWLDVKYAELHDSVQIPDEYLLAAVRGLRGNLESAVVLERELGGYGLGDLVPIEPDPDLEGGSTGRLFGLAVLFLMYVDLFRRLLEVDINAARQECSTWWVDDETIFARLRIWGCRQARLLSGADAGALITKLTDRVFWDIRHQRDLLLVLAGRWHDFPPAVRTQLEERLLMGPPRWEEEQDAKYVERCAWSALDRIYWLQRRGCKFSLGIEAETTKLQALAPEWGAESGEKAAASTEARSGWVKTEKESEPLLLIPLSNVLNRAVELSGWQHGKFVKSDPFSGLASTRPIRALSALRVAGKGGEYPEWAWKTFLTRETQKPVRPKLLALTAERIFRIPQDAFAPLAYSVSEWLLTSSPVLLREYPRQFDLVWGAVVSALRGGAERGRSSVIRGHKEPEWATEALNSPVGKLAQALMKDPQKENLQAGKGFPPSWLQRVDELLSLDGDPRRHALVFFTYNLHWFFAIDPPWTETHLLSAFEAGAEDRAAAWAGLFWRARVPTERLYLRLKPHLLELAKSRSVSRRGHIDGLAGFVLAGWGNPTSITGARAVTDAEMRDVLVNSDEEFRMRVLWQLERLSASEEHWSEQVETFLRDVWPRQIRAKSPTTSARLCELALSNPARFPAIVEAALPLLTTTDGEHLLLQDLSGKDRIVERYPEHALALLYAVLPAEIGTWPFGIAEALDRIASADTALEKDPRLMELRRRWNAR